MRPRDARLSSFGSEPEPQAVEVRDAEPPALSVSAIIAAVNHALGKDPRFVDVWVRGEVSGLTQHSSGHWYFDLKDDGAVLKAVMFRAANSRVRFAPEDGMEVLARGQVQVYRGKSQVQVVVSDLRPVGVGPLQVAFEQVRRRLDAEGLFAPGRKRELPRFPRVVGVVTSLQGAVLRDVVRTARRRFPAMRLLVAGARVQGEGAAAEVARGIQALNREGSAEVIIVARGGGSMEDLWCFNEEAVVRAVAASRIPVVSAVGHETDFTLCDFAADARASTPTAAAEMLSPDAGALFDGLHDAERRMARALESLVPDLRRSIDDALARSDGAMRRLVAREKDLLLHRVARLHALSPLGTLARGYAIVRREGRVVRAVGDAPVGSEVEIVLPDGRAEAKVTKHVEDEDV